jgi:hypothetical protein
MKMSRHWAMPNKNTFEINPVKKIINKYIEISGDVLSVDPFANKNKLAKITNDLDPIYKTDYNLDAIDFLKGLKENEYGLVFFDPPFSPRQVSECYKKLGMTVNKETTQASYWSKLKKEISRITLQGAYVISCGWNSGGIGINNNFEIIEIALIAHGGWHNDTIITVEKKV